MELKKDTNKHSTIYTYKDFIFGSILLLLVLNIAWKFSTSRQEYFHSTDYFLPPAIMHMGLMVAVYAVWTFVHSRQNKSNEVNR